VKATKPLGLRLFALLAIFALVVAACTNGDTTNTTDGDSEDTDTSTNQTGATDEQQADQSVVEGEIFKIGLITNISTDNWWAALDTMSSSVNQAYLGNSKTSLFRLTNPGFVYVPGIAATPAPVKAVPEGDVWVVEQPIRTDVMWSDDVPVTAHDLAFYFDVQREFNLGGNHASSFAPSIVSVTAVADDVVRIEFDSEPGVAAWQNGIGLASFVPARFWEPHVEEARRVAAELAATITTDQAREALVEASLVDEDLDNDLTPESVTPEAIESWIGNAVANESLSALYSVSAPREPSAGSQVFDRWEVGKVAVTISNPTYFNNGTENTLYSDGTVRIANSGREEDNFYGGPGEGDVVATYVEGPFISEIHWIEHNTKDAAYESLFAGNVDYVYDPTGLSAGFRSQLAANPDLRFSVSQTEHFRYMAFNMRKAPMSDLAFRQAVATVINKEFVSDIVLGGVVSPAYTIIHPGLTASYNSAVPKAGWVDGEPMSEADRFLAAVQILKDAGYTWVTEPLIDPQSPDPVSTPGAGLTMPNGAKVPELTILAPGSGYDPARATFSVWIEQWLNDLGIPVVADTTDFSAIVSKVFPPQTEKSAQGWDMYVLGWAGGDVSLRGTLQVAFFHSREDSVTGGGFNTPGYASQRFDDTADAFEAATRFETAAELTKEMDLIIAEDLPYVVLFRTNITEAYRARVEFPTQVIMGGHFGFPNAWPSAVVVSE